MKVVFGFGRPETKSIDDVIAEARDRGIVRHREYYLRIYPLGLKSAIQLSLFLSIRQMERKDGIYISNIISLYHFQANLEVCRGKSDTDMRKMQHTI